MNKRIFIGLAWPYASGSLHLGHISALLGGDILARYHRLNNDKVLLVSGSDCYGTPIAVEAAGQGVEPSEIADRYHQEFKDTLINGLKFSYDIYTRTTTDHHAKVVQGLFLDLYKKGYLYTKTEKALYSPFLGRFLPDRFVEGKCPKCGYSDARGDQCDNCGSLLAPLELKNPRINPKILQQQKKLRNDDFRLEVRQSEHFYFKLSSFGEKLQQWTEERSDSWRTNARTLTKGLLKQGLRDRAITRDTDWGVSIPLAGYENKRIYVWFEAVTGYLSASKLWAKEKGQADEWKEFWLNDDAVHYYFHGKDNIPFHTIIWPAILLAQGNLHTPDRIVSSEHLTLEGKQFSKSRSWAIWLPDFLEAFDPETLRFFLTVNGPETSDANFVWTEYAQLVNGELIATFGNLVNRVLSFSQKEFPNGLRLAVSLDQDSGKLLGLTERSFQKIGGLIEKGKFRLAWMEIRNVAEHGNRFVDKKAPWNKVKDKAKRDELETDLAVLSHTIQSLAILVNPFLPVTSERILGFFGVNQDKIRWKYPEPQKTQRISHLRPLYQKIEESEIEKQKELLNKSRDRVNTG